MVAPSRMSDQEARTLLKLLSFAEMTDKLQSSALTPSPSPAAAGEGSIVTEMVVNHFRKTQ